MVFDQLQVLAEIQCSKVLKPESRYLLTVELICTKSRIQKVNSSHGCLIFDFHIKI